MDLGAAWVCMKGFFDREGPHPIRPLKIHYIQTTTHATYIHTPGLPLGLPSEASQPLCPRCHLDFKVSKSKRHRGHKTEARANKKILHCTSLGGGAENPTASSPLRGGCCGCAGTCPRQARKNLPASPPFAGGNAGVARVRAPGRPGNIGQHHPLLQGQCWPTVQT